MSTITTTPTKRRPTPQIITMPRPQGKAHVALHPMGKWKAHGMPQTTESDAGIPLDKFQTSGITNIQYKYPVKVIIPQHASSSMCQWVYFMSYGGGLVEGDDLQLQLDVQEQCCCLLTTQASTKIYECLEGQTTRQTITCQIAPNSLLAIIPDPIIPFKHSRYAQKQKVTMCVDSNLVLLDWLTAGRMARGEIWQFDSLSTCNQVEIDGEVMYREACCLQDSPYQSVARAMDKYKAIGTLLVLGPLLKPLVKTLYIAMGKHKAFDDTYSCASMTSISHLRYTVESGTITGCMVRFVGPSTAQVLKLIHDMLRPLYPVLGGDPLSK